MQDLSYLATGGVLNFDPNAYLNSPVVGNTNPYSQIGLLPQGTKLQNQPAKDGFISKNKDTIKKAVAGTILVGLAAGKIAEAISGKKDIVTKAVDNTIKQGKGFLSDCLDKVTKFFKK